MVTIELAERIGDGTGNINVNFEVDRGESVPYELLRWVSYMDVWNSGAHVYSSNDKYELAKEMKPYLYSESFKFFVAKFFRRMSEFRIICY